MRHAGPALDLQSWSFAADAVPVPPTRHGQVQDMQALIIDDSAVMRFLIAEVLTELSFGVRHAEDAVSALRELEQGPHIDLVVVDQNLPGVSGLHVVAAVRRRATSAGVRVLMVSAEGHSSFLEQALAAGVDEYLFKPFTWDALVSKVELLRVGESLKAADV